MGLMVPMGERPKRKSKYILEIFNGTVYALQPRQSSFSDGGPGCGGWK